LDFSVSKLDILDNSFEITSVGVFEGEGYFGISTDNALNQHLSNIFSSKEFEGKTKQLTLLHIDQKQTVKRILLVGLGKREAFTLEASRIASGKALQFIRNLGFQSYASKIFGDRRKISLSNLVESLVVGCELTNYQFSKYKTIDLESQKKINIVTILLESDDETDVVRSSISTAQIICNGVNLARDISNTPSSDATPSQIAEEAKRISRENGLNCIVLEVKDMEKLGMGGLLNVSRGSQQPPRFIIIEHKLGDDEKPIVFVGKGITFDSGGISIKPSEKMEDMKHDKSGAASVIGLMQTVAKLKLRLNIIGVTPLTENLPSGTAYKPGDVLKMSNGKTVEVISTDAEGRLILADALTYVSKYTPQAVIDIATLTGACVIALGSVATGLLGNDEDLKSRLKLAGDITGERVWELPLWDEYKDQIKSEIADMKNVGGRPGGTITAASFLSNFVDYPWAHLDIAGTAWTQEGTPERPYLPKGASGIGVRLFVELLRNWRTKQ